MLSSTRFIAGKQAQLMGGAIGQIARSVHTRGTEQSLNDKRAAKRDSDIDNARLSNSGNDAVMYENFQPPQRDQAPTKQMLVGEDFIATHSVRDVLNEKPEKFRNLSVVSMKETETALSAARRMTELNMGSVLVVPSELGDASGMASSASMDSAGGERGKVQTIPALGIFTIAHFVKAVLMRERDPSKTTLGEVMTRGVTCIASDQTLDHALTRFLDSRLRNLPVIENAHAYGGNAPSPHHLPRVSGMLSMTDLHRSLAQRIQNYPFFEDTSVRDVLALPGSGLKFGVVEPNLDQLRVGHSSTIQDTLQLMLKHKSKFAFVHQGSSFIGLLTLRDCVRAIIDDKIDARALPVEKLMQTDITVVTPDFPLHQAMKALIQSDKFVLPVTAYIADTFDGDLRLAGVVSVLDVLQMFHYKYHLAKHQSKEQPKKQE